MREPLVLAESLGLTFENRDLLGQALRHRSSGRVNNERLEFLGDSILNVTISDYLYRHKPECPEGALSRLRASVVREETLARVARRIGLGDYLVMGSGELKSGGHRRDSILADALEAVIGALYLDQGFHPARDWVVELFSEELVSLPDAQELKDAKTQLQEFLQRDRLPLPEYEVIEQSGQAHKQVFEVACRVAHDSAAFVTRATGSSRRRAEQTAARRMLNTLREASGGASRTEDHA
ncbi:MAG: ribonuclease III [Halothiobacillaceae bacterium]|nr:ribonuclease III [Halothiobacillaceae bacterium]